MGSIKIEKKKVEEENNLQLSISILQSWESIGKCLRSMGHAAVTVNLIERRISPSAEIRRNSLEVVAS